MTARAIKVFLVGLALLVVGLLGGWLGRATTPPPPLPFQIYGEGGRTYVYPCPQDPRCAPTPVPH